MARRPSGRYDFVRQGGDLERTDDWSPAMIRLLIQGEWIGDDGEREGEALPDVKFISQGTDAQVRRIVSRRLGKLIDREVLEFAQVLRVLTEDSQVYVEVSVKRPGKDPETLQVPVTK